MTDPARIQDLTERAQKGKRYEALRANETFVEVFTDLEASIKRSWFTASPVTGDDAERLAAQERDGMWAVMSRLNRAIADGAAADAELAMILAEQEAQAGSQAA